MVEEERIITGENGGKYLIVKEIENDVNGRFFFALGINDNYEIDYDNNIIFKAEKDGDAEYVTALDENSEEFQELTATYALKIMSEYVPGVKQKAEEIIKKLEEEDSK
jgi:hypothetical protein